MYYCLFSFLIFSVLAACSINVNLNLNVVIGCVLFEWPDPVGPSLAGYFACGR